jgi:hypothetical protein
LCYLYGLTVSLLSLADVVLLAQPSAHAQTVKPQASAVGPLPPVPTPLVALLSRSKLAQVSDRSQVEYKEDESCDSRRVSEASHKRSPVFDGNSYNT